MAPALEQGRVSATGVIEPFITQMRGVANPIANLNAALGNRYLVARWFAMKPYIEQNPEAVRSFTVAIRQTARWANAHPKESAAILARYAKMDSGLADVITRAHYAEDATFGPQLLKPVIDTMVRYGKVAPVSATDLIWPAFLPH